MQTITIPYIGLGLHVVVALFFAIHALRTGRSLYWLFVLFSFPLLGSVAYFFVEYLPELRFNRAARGAAHAVTKFINPDGELREAQRAFDQTATVGNRIRLAHALLGKGDAQGAAAQFRECAQGAFADDPDVLYGLVDAEFACGNAPAAAAAMNTLFKLHPARNTGAAALLYARVLAIAEPDAAEAAFDHAMTTGTGPEPLIRYGEWLRSKGRNADAAQHFQQVVDDARHWPSRTRSSQKDWLRQAREGLTEINSKLK
ncbi:MAG: hypothetical protein ABIZ64_07615 [Casimicrobium sp.]|jgi:hypothetical protein